MLHYSLEVLAGLEAIGSTIVVVPESALGDFEAVLAELPASINVEALVSGGATRQESVRLGLEAIGAETEVVLCHDAARPLATSGLFGRVIQGVEGVEGCVPVVSSPDTVKQVRDGRVTRTVPREEIGLAQTPQAFRCTVLREAHERARGERIQATDDAMLVEMAGYRVAVVAGEISNFKVTTRDDLLRAEQVLAAREELVRGPRRE
jgi:2-C-methyl-D-erythritol 4-phosphate cytidylyltransferase